MSTVATRGKEAEEDAAGLSVEEVVSRAEAEGWDGGGFEQSGDTAPSGDADGLPPAAAVAAGGDEKESEDETENESENERKDGSGAADAGEQERQNRREAIMDKQREALAALRKAEEQDQLQLVGATEDEHRRKVEEWDAMEQQ